MQKRGQVTIFIIMGIIILLAAGSFFILKDKFVGEKVIAESPETASIISFIEQCLEKSTIKALYTTLEKGGYYQFPEDVSLLSFTEEENVFTLPYYFQDKQSSLPPISDIAAQTSIAALAPYETCLNDFAAFKKVGYIIDAGEPKIKVAFTRSGTRASLSQPIKIKIGEKETGYNQFTALIPFDLVTKYEFIQKYLQTQEESPESFLISPLSIAAEEQDFIYGFDQYGEDGKDVVLHFTYDEGLQEEPIVYQIGMNFEWKTEKIDNRQPTFSSKQPSSVVLRSPDEWNITLPGIYTLPVKAEGVGISFQTDSLLLPINEKNGIITLDTAKFPNDEYLYYILAQDIFGHSSIAPLLINVNVNPGNMPIIEEISPQLAIAGKEFVLPVNILNKRNQQFTFTDQSYLFDITNDGEIRFTSEEGQRGLHSARIDVENEFGKTWERFTIEIR